MTHTRKFVLVGMIVIATVGVVFVTVPPYRTYAPESVVQSVISEAILPTDARPEIEWTDGARKFWRTHPAEVRIFGLEEVAAQDRILNSVRKHLAETDLPEIVVRFFPKGRTSTHPVEAMRYTLIRK
jgi:hypothetical protein